jgi:hypothetical protein
MYLGWKYSSTFLGFCARWKWVVSFTTMPLLPRRRSPWYQLYIPDDILCANCTVIEKCLFVSVIYLEKKTMNFLSVSFAPRPWACLHAPIKISVNFCFLIGSRIIQEARKVVVIPSLRTEYGSSWGRSFWNITEKLIHSVCHIRKIIGHLFEATAWKV